MATEYDLSGKTQTFIEHLPTTPIQVQGDKCFRWAISLISFHLTMKKLRHREIKKKLFKATQQQIINQ